VIAERRSYLPLGARQITPDRELCVLLSYVVCRARLGPDLSGVRDTEVRWAEIDGTSIAYEVFGTGPIDLLVGQMWCPIDLMWELPQLASFLGQLGSMARVIVFDQLGGGVSDRVVDRMASTAETFADASLAVLDAVSSPRRGN